MRGLTQTAILYKRLGRQSGAVVFSETGTEFSCRIEEETYRGAVFYDSTTRTKRSAISAYEGFLAEYPQSVHADEIKARIAELKGASGETDGGKDN